MAQLPNVHQTTRIPTPPLTINPHADKMIM